MSQTKEQKAAYDKEYYIKNKEAICDRVKTYQEDNREKRLAQQKEYREKNKEAIKEYREKNKEQIAAQQKEYNEKNKEQIAAQQKEYYEKNKEQIAAQRKEYNEKNKEQKAAYWREKKYGLSSEDYKNMLDEQNDKCKICLTSFTILDTKHIHVDHCHTTNKIRGILCGMCNLGLGHFKDDIQKLTKAINYLQENT
jgi:hypothetical protein